MTGDGETAAEAVARAAADPEGRALVQAILDRKEEAEADARWKQLRDAPEGVRVFLVPKDVKVGDTVQYLGVVARH